MRFEICFEVKCFSTDMEFTGFGAEDLVIEADTVGQAAEIAFALIGEERGLKEYLYRVILITPTGKPPSGYHDDIATWRGVLARMEDDPKRYEFRYGDRGAIIGLRRKATYARKAEP